MKNDIYDRKKIIEGGKKIKDERIFFKSLKNIICALAYNTKKLIMMNNNNNYYY